MVKGIDGNGDNIIRLKGHKQNIDLDKLACLRKTEQNKPLFEKFDENNNGILEQNEAGKMKGWIADAAGNKTLSKHEMKKAAEGQENLFDSLVSLGKQQSELYDGKVYKEVNDGVETTILKEKETIVKYDESIDANGNLVCTFENGDKFIEDSSGKVIAKITHRGGKEIRTDIEYDGNKKIEKETIVGKFSSITVSENKNKQAIDTIYTSEEDFKNNKPSEEIINDKWPKHRVVTKFSYDSKGNVKAETTNPDGSTKTTYKNSEGKEIKAEDFENEQSTSISTPAPISEVVGTYTVKKGEGINKIVKNALKEQGIENPTKEQLQKAKEEFLELNKDMVKTYHGVKQEWHGSKFFYANDKVKIPKFKFDEAVEEAKTPDTKTPTEVTEPAKTTKQAKTTEPAETIKPANEDLKNQIQHKLGEKYIVEINNDGKIVIKDKEGLEYPNASNFVNNSNFDLNSLDVAQDGKLIIKDKNGNILYRASNKANDTISDNEEINQMMKIGDKDKDKALDRAEYHDLIWNLFEQYEISVAPQYEPAVNQLIEKSFDEMNVIEADSEISFRELNKKAKEIITKLTEEVGDVLIGPEPGE